jgi:L-iditol 2-dehydrogenase
MSLPKKARAAVLTGYGRPLEIREIDIPPLEPGAILVRVNGATVCGTDVHMWKGHYRAVTRPPIVPGHEIVGQVVALGDGRDRDADGQAIKEGDRICWSYAWCGKCHYCKIARQPTLCQDRRAYGWLSCDKHPYLTGGYSNYAYVLPNCDIVKVPDGVSSAVAAAASCSLRTAIHAFERLGGLGIAEPVVVQGCGQVAELFGIGPVFEQPAPDARDARVTRLTPRLHTGARLVYERSLYGDAGIVESL